MMPLLVVLLQVKDQAFLGLLQRQLQQRSAAVPAAYSAADADLAEQQAAQLASSAFSRVRECTQTRRSSPPPLATAVSRSTCQCHAVGVDTAVPQNRAVLPVGAVGLNGRHTGPRDRFAQGNRRGGKIPSLPCVSTALVAKTLPLPCVPTNAFATKTLPLHCVPTAFAAETAPFLAALRPPRQQ